MEQMRIASVFRISWMIFKLGKTLKVVCVSDFGFRKTRKKIREAPEGFYAEKVKFSVCPLEAK